MARSGTYELGRARALQTGRSHQEGSWTSQRSCFSSEKVFVRRGSLTGAKRDVRAWPRPCAPDGKESPGRILILDLCFEGLVLSREECNFQEFTNGREAGRTSLAAPVRSTREGVTRKDPGPLRDPASLQRRFSFPVVHLRARSATYELGRARALQTGRSHQEGS